MLLVHPGALAAQFAPDTLAVVKTRLPVAAWVAFGAGPGTVSGSSTGLLAGAARVNLSVGAMLLTARTSEVGPVFSAGPRVRDNALLAGLRSADRRVFATGAVGVASAQRVRDGTTSCGPAQDCPRVTALTWDVGFHANYIVPGISASWSGVGGAGSVSYSAFSLAVELGWFGR